MSGPRDGDSFDGDHVREELDARRVAELVGARPSALADWPRVLQVLLLPAADLGAPDSPAHLQIDRVRAPVVEHIVVAVELDEDGRAGWRLALTRLLLGGSVGAQQTRRLDC